ncbi:MAG TPA: glutamate ABC transporter substrate-binding protein [Acidimicrobiales bacterium]
MPRRGRAAALAVALALVAGCTQTDVPEELPGPTSTTVPPTEAPPETADCDPATVTQSLRPEGPATTDVDRGSYMATIRDRGRLRVGVDTSTLLFSSVDPLTGDFEGFDVDIAREVATALFGRPDAIEFVAIPKSERVTALLDEEDALDLVADSFTINCERAAEIDFSSEYFTSHQKLLVRSDDPATSVEELVANAEAAGGDPPKVCAPAGSTSLRNLEALADPPELVAAPSQGSCLVKLQRGEVAAISTDDTILAGMVAQDPNLAIVGEPFSTEPYGLGVPPGREEWVRYVNAVLEDVRDSGRWSELYDEWFAAHMDPAEAPEPAYRD